MSDTNWSSRQSYTGNGSQTSFVIGFPFLATSDIYVYIGGVLQSNTTYTFSPGGVANPTSIVFNTAPANAAAITFRRFTDKTVITQLPFGTTPSTAELNSIFLRQEYLNQEAADAAIQGAMSLLTATQWNAEGFTITNLANGVNTNDAVTVSQLNGKQNLNSNLTALSGLTGSASILPYFTGAGTMATTPFSTFAQTANNLSDLASASSARTNLGLGTAALQANSFFAQTANNLSDLASASSARTNLGLGTAATLPLTTWLQVSNNLSDLGNITTARSNLGLGAAALQANSFFCQTANNLSDVVSKTISFNNISPLTTLGDTPYFDGTNNVRLAPNTTSTKMYLSMTGTGTVGAAPAWAQPSFADLSGNIAIGQIASGTGASSTTFLRGDNTWATPSGGGNVTGPASSTNLAIALWNGTSGQLLQNGPSLGSSGQVLMSNGGVAPSFQSVNTGFKNMFCNGLFQVWQRGTASTSCPTSTLTFLADRFYVNPSGAAITQQQSTSLPSGGSAQSSYSLLLTGAASVTTVNIGQRIESINMKKLTGTISFQMKIFNGTGASFTPTLILNTPTAADNYTSVNNVKTQALQSCSNNTWTTVTFTGSALGYTQLANGLEAILQIPTGVLVATKTVNICDAQLELNTFPSPMENMPYDLDLNRCMRYFETIGDGTSAEPMGVGYASSTSAANIVTNFLVQKRVVPTLTISGNSNFQINNSTATEICNAASLQSTSKNSVLINWANANAVYAANQAMILESANTTGFMYLSAEI